MKIIGFGSKTAPNGDGGTGLSLSEMPEGYAADDYAIAMWSQDAENAFTLTWSGATTVRNTTGNGASILMAYKKLTASETPPSAKSASTTEETNHTLIVVRGLAGTSVLDTSAVDSSHSSGTDHHVAGITTSTNNCWVLHYHISDGDTWPFVSPEFMLIDPPPSVNGVSYSSCFWTYQKTAGAADRPHVYLSKTDGALCISAAFKCSTTNEPARLGSAPTTIINPLAFGDTTGDFNGGVFDPTASLTSGQINSTAFNYDNAPQESGGYPSPLSTYQGSRFESPSAANNPEYWGLGWSHTEIDLSSKAWVIHAQPTVAGEELQIDSASVGGLTFGLRSDSGGASSGPAFRFWKFSGINALPAPGFLQAYVAQVDNTSLALSTDGTFESDRVDGIVAALKRQGSSTVSRFQASSARALETIQVVGGYSSEPAMLSTLADGLKASAVMTVSNQLGGSTAQYSGRQSVQIGDGSSNCFFADPNSSFEFAPLSSGRIQNNRVAADFNSWDTYLAAGNTADYRNMVFGGPAGWPFTFNASTSSSATYHIGTVIGAAPVLQAVTLTTGGTWINCGEITHNGANFTAGAIFDGCTDTQQITLTGSTEAALQSLLDNYANCLFKNGSTYAITISYTGTGDISIVGPSNLTFSNNGTADLFYTSTNASALTFTPGSGAGSPSTAFGGSATGVTVDSSTPLTISSPNLPDNTFYEFFNITQDAVLVTGTVSGGSGASYTTTIGAGLSVEDSDQIELRPMYHVSGTYKEPDTGHDGPAIVQQASAGSNIVFLTEMVDWDALNTWGHDSGTLSEFSTDLVNIDIDLDDADGISQRTRIVAYWAGEILTTAAGIRDFWGAYTVESAASIKQNVNVVDVLLHNVASLNILFNDDTVRYYRSDGSNPYDTSGNSIFMHYNGTPHTVDTGSGGFSSADRADLQAAKASAATSASNTSSIPTATEIVDEWETQSQADPTGFLVNVKEVNSVEIIGTGEDADRFRTAGSSS